MDLQTKIKLIERLDSLIRKKATGTPKELAEKIGISERQLYNIINEMKSMGAPIIFCTINRTYTYRERVVFRFGFSIDKEALMGAKGGIQPTMIVQRFTSLS